MCAAPRGGDRAGGARAHEGLLAPAALEQGDDECSAEGVAGRGPVDGTAAGDAFTACLVVSLLEGLGREDALRRACAAGALAASRFGAQTSLPTAAEVDALL